MEAVDGGRLILWREGSGRLRFAGALHYFADSATDKFRTGALPFNLTLSAKMCYAVVVMTPPDGRQVCVVWDWTESPSFFSCAIHHSGDSVCCSDTRFSFFPAHKLGASFRQPTPASCRTLRGLPVISYSHRPFFWFWHDIYRAFHSATRNMFRVNIFIHKNWVVLPWNYLLLWNDFEKPFPLRKNKPQLPRISPNAIIKIMNTGKWFQRQPFLYL